MQQQYIIGTNETLHTKNNDNTTLETTNPTINNANITRKFTRNKQATI